MPGLAEDMDTIATSFDIVDDRVAAMQEINRNLRRLNRGNREATVMFEEVQACYRQHCGDDSALWNSLPKHDATSLSPQSMQKALLRNATKLKLDLETYDD